MNPNEDWLARLFPELEQLAEDQEWVASDYKKRYFLTDQESRDLHMFFSPTRVPEGLTEGEVRIVLLLYDLRNTHRSKEVGTGPGFMKEDLGTLLGKMMLPAELLPSGEPMTRERFKIGVWKYLQQVAVSVVKNKLVVDQRTPTIE